MPLLIKKNFAPNNKLGVWKINEELEELMIQAQPNELEKKHLEKIKVENGKKQWLVSRAILKKLTGLYDLEIKYDPYGKPYLKDSKYKISISHSHQYVAAIIDIHHTGIDIQIQDSKIERIVPRFMSLSEQGSIKNENRLGQIYIYWCAKEALYKLYGQRSLSFRENILISPFDYNAEGGNIFGRISVSSFNRSYSLQYKKIENYTQVYVMNN